jgi:hypothetical protein
MEGLKKPEVEITGEFNNKEMKPFITVKKL